jgi:hypothetical protein
MNVVIALLIVMLLAAILIPLVGLRRNSEARQQEVCKGKDEGVLMV